MKDNFVIPNSQTCSIGEQMTGYSANTYLFLKPVQILMSENSRQIPETDRPILTDEMSNLLEKGSLCP